MAIAAAQTAIIGCRLAMPDDARSVMEQEGTYEFKDLPLEGLSDNPKTTHFVQVIAVTTDLPGHPDISASTMHSATRQICRSPLHWQMLYQSTSCNVSSPTLMASRP